MVAGSSKLADEPWPNPSVERTGKWRLGWFVMQA